MNIKRLFSMQRSKNTKTTLVAFLVFFISLLGFSLLSTPAQAIGQMIPTMDQTFTGSGLPMVNLTVFIIGILRVFFGLLGVIALGLLLYGGFIWMTSAGEPDKVTKAKQIIYNTIIGLIIIFSAFAIATFVMNFLRGIGGGTSSGGSNIPGGSGDFGRAAIGAGPIESVYPQPNQVNVPINTNIAVTFKQDIVANSICMDATADGGNNNGLCDGEAVRNVSICEISATGTACLAGEFDSTNFTSTTVNQVKPTDFKTFIFRANKYLGAQDEKIRVFKVNLASGINAISTGKSIFDGYRQNYYNWAFKTNGVLDFSPPEVAQFQIVPNPDSIADGYTVNTAASVGSSTINIPAIITPYHPVLVRNADTGQDVPYLGTALANIPLTSTTGGLATGFKLYFSGTIHSSSTQTKEYNMVVASNGTSVTLTNNIDGSGWKDLGVDATSLPIDGRRQISTNAGFILTATGDLPQSSSWKLIVTPETSGSSLVFSNGGTTNTFVYVPSDYAYPAVISPRVTQSDGGVVTKTFNTIVIGANQTVTGENTASALNKVVGTSISASANAGIVTINPVSAGTNNLSFVGTGSLAGTITGNLAGTNRQMGRIIRPLGSKADPYNNSVFRISFTEAISPINVDNSIIVTINGAQVVASTTIINGFRTIELTGTHDCGVVNSCGKKMYCWLDANSSTTASIAASIEVRSARLRFCLPGNGGTQTATQNSWCSNFGGTCSSVTDGGRCKLSTGLYYPQAFWAADNAGALRAVLSTTTEATEKSGQNWGVVDMSDNSFNGNFDKAANAKGYMMGNAQGRSGIGFGLSGVDAYYANNHMDGASFNYEVGTSTGDSFRWSFFISTQIDTASPLLTSLSPAGDYALGNLVGETFGQPIKFAFNTLMRFATLKGGFGYGQSASDPAWNIRYLLLNTVTKSANPVGYWASSNDIDFDQDGLADYTLTDLNHNPFDQAVTYGPMAGSGLESVTQNCFLPGSGPQNAGDLTTSTAGGVEANNCKYDANGNTAGCVTDTAIPVARRVTSTNPSSYGYMKCADISGAVACNNSCKVHGATSTNSLPGSWIVTKDNSRIAGSEKTGCCFGVCK